MVTRRAIFATLAFLALAVASCGAPEPQPGGGQGRSAPPAAATPNFCGGVDALYPEYDLADLAWTSRQIVVGTVVEQLPPAVVADPRGTPTIGERAGPAAAGNKDRIVTDYTVRVERQFRSLPVQTIRVRRPGGTIGGCTQVYDSEPPLAVGDRVLLFLTGKAAQTAAVPVYGVNAGRQGAWAVKPEGTVDTRLQHLQPFNGKPLDEVGRQLRGALAGAPPATLPRPFVVPLEEAPLPATPTVPRP